jgi:hypothetical protein
MRYSKVHIMEKERDPLNLRGLPLVSPPQDDWPVIQTALLQQSKRRRVARLAASAVAIAATVALAVGLFIHTPVPTQVGEPGASAQSGVNTVESLIALSQQLESQLRLARSELGGMPTDALIYQVELEDMVAQVDEELSLNPDSLKLWSRRINLLLDLDQLYQNQLRRDYQRMASL